MTSPRRSDRRTSWCPGRSAKSSGRCGRVGGIAWVVLPHLPSFRDGALAPDHRCAIAHRGISRFRVRCLASPRNDGAKLRRYACKYEKKTSEETIMAQSAKRVVLASRPVGEPKPSDFRIEDYTPPSLGDG